MDPCPKCGSSRTKDMGRTGGGAGWGGEKIEVKDDHEWMKCADCEAFSRRPLSGGEWEPYDPAQF